MPITVVGLDGDDTLWHNETRFKLTQAELRYDLMLITKGRSWSA